MRWDAIAQGVTGDRALSAEDRRWLSRRVLTPLVLALPSLVVAFSVTMAGFLFAEALGDPAAVRALRWAGFILLMLIVFVSTLLLGVLGLRALPRYENEDDGSADMSRPGDDRADPCDSGLRSSEQLPAEQPPAAPPPR